MKRNVVLMQVYAETREILREWNRLTTIDMQELIDSAVKEKYLKEVIGIDGKCSEVKEEAEEGTE